MTFSMNKTLVGLCTLNELFFPLERIHTAVGHVFRGDGTSIDEASVLAELRELYREGLIAFQKNEGVPEFKRTEPARIGGISIRADAYLLLDFRGGAAHQERPPRVGYLNLRGNAWLPNITNPHFSVPTVPDEIAENLTAVLNWCATVGKWVK